MERVKILASEADIAIVFVNADSGEEFITVEGNKGDRNDLSLWHNGDNLVSSNTDTCHIEVLSNILNLPLQVNAVADANNRTIVVVHSVGPIMMPWINHPHIKAVVLPGLPGQESGNSLADILFGDVNPSGRLPYTIAQNRNHYPTRIDRGQSVTTITYEMYHTL